MASRETLDHSLPYIFAVALEDGAWQHEASYAPERARRQRTVEIWQKIKTEESPSWTARYQAGTAYGGRVVILFKDGRTLEDEVAIPDAHPKGAQPFGPEQYREKFLELSGPMVHLEEQQRFLALAARLGELTAGEVRQLNFRADRARVPAPAPSMGLFEGAPGAH